MLALGTEAFGLSQVATGRPACLRNCGARQI